MILAIDIGNTTVALGGIRDGRVCFVARMDTVRTRTAAEYRAEMDKIFAHRRHPERPMRFEGAVLTSVVPQITGALAECARHYTGKKPVIVSPDIRTGLTMGVDEPRAVGKDRLVDAAYAAANFPLPIVTVDLGTATTFNVVDKDRVFRGGVICPGLSTGLRALGERCAQLPQVHLGSPKKAIGTNTESCMLSGSVLGTAVLIDGGCGGWGAGALPGGVPADRNACRRHGCGRAPAGRSAGTAVPAPSSAALGHRSGGGGTAG